MLVSTKGTLSKVKQHKDFSKEHPTVTLYFSAPKGTGKLAKLSAGMFTNGNSLYVTTVDLSAVYGWNGSKETIKLFEDDFPTGESYDVNLYEFSISELTDGKYTSVFIDETREMMTRRIASFDTEKQVFTRESNRMLRRIKDGKFYKAVKVDEQPEGGEE